MSSRNSAFQPFGQRSIKSSALFRSSIPEVRGKDAKEDADGGHKVGTRRVSLSEFLGRKLPRTSALPGTVQGKVKPFLTLLGTRDANELGTSQDCKKKALVEKKHGVDKAVFEQFKLTCKESGEDRGIAIGSNEGGGSAEVDGGRESRKRSNPFNGWCFNLGSQPLNDGILIFSGDLLKQMIAKDWSFISRSNLAFRRPRCL